MLQQTMRSKLLFLNQRVEQFARTTSICNYRQMKYRALSTYLLSAYFPLVKSCKISPVKPPATSCASTMPPKRVSRPLVFQKFIHQLGMWRKTEEYRKLSISQTVGRANFKTNQTESDSRQLISPRDYFAVQTKG